MTGLLEGRAACLVVSGDLEGRNLRYPVEIGIVVKKEQVVLDGRLGDQAVHGASHGHSFFPQVEKDLRGRGVGIEAPGQAIDPLAAEVFAQCREILRP